MAGMAGNVSAFATVWTYDIYRAFIKKDASDAHYVAMGRWCTILGVFVSIGTAYLVMQFSSIMDYVQALFSFFIAPLFGTVLLGMLWKRATPAGGFWGLLAGTRLVDRHVGLGQARPRRAARTSRSRRTPRRWPRTCTAALWSWIICVVVTVVVSLLTGPSRRASWSGLVYGCTAIPSEQHICRSGTGRSSGPPSWPWYSLYFKLFSGRRSCERAQALHFDLVVYRRPVVDLRRSDPRVRVSMITSTRPRQRRCLRNLHPQIWWGALLLVMGAVYCWNFRPGKQK